MRILFATDGSGDAKSAAAFLARLPLPPATVIRILSVVTLPPSPIDIPTVREYYDSLRAQAQRAVEDSRAVLSRAPSIETVLREGDPRTEIAREARAWGADLVVVGARGLGAVAGFLLGSVSTAVTRHVEAAVLVVKGNRPRLQQIVVAVDGSDGSLSAARFLAALPFGRGCAIRLVGAVAPLHIPGAAPAALRRELDASVRMMEDERRAILDKSLDHAATFFEPQGLSVARATPRGNPAQAILEAAWSADADLIVLGARGLGGIARLLLGSVSENVLRAARCPVLVVKPPRRSSRYVRGKGGRLADATARALFVSESRRRRASRRSR